MAKRRGGKRRRTKSYARHGGSIVRAVAPVVVRERVSAPVHHRRRHHSGGGGGSGGELMSKENTGLAMGAVALGFIDKQQMFSKWTIPGVGRAGTIAIAAHYAGKQFKSPFLHKISKAAIVIALYELGNKGQIAGVDVL